MNSALGVPELPFSFNQRAIDRLRREFGEAYLNPQEGGDAGDWRDNLYSGARKGVIKDLISDNKALEKYLNTGSFDLGGINAIYGVTDQRLANAILTKNYELQRQQNPELYSKANQLNIKYTPLTTLDELQRKVTTESAYNTGYDSLRTGLRGVEGGGAYLAQNPQLSRSERTSTEGKPPVQGRTQLQNLEAKLDELKTAARVRDEERTDTIRDATQEDDLEKIEKDKAGQLAITERQEAGATTRQTLANQGALEVATLQGNTSIQNTNSTNRTNLQSLQATLQDSAEGRRLDQEQFLAQLADAAAARSADNKIAMAQFQAQMEMAQRRDERAERRDQKNDRMAMITMLMKGLSQLGAGFAL